MELDTLLATAGLLGLVVAALSARIRRLPLSEPLLALTVGMLLGQVLRGQELPTLVEDHALMHEASRALLAVSVMSVALRYPVRAVRDRLGTVAVLLLVAMPLMALTSAGLAALTLGLPLATALLLGAALCPTDPVLASSVVTGDAAERDLPARDRQVLSLESGANDGLALPLVLVAVAVAGPLTAPDAVFDSLWQVAAATALGAAAGWAAGWTLRRGEAHGSTETEPAVFFTLLLALGVLGLAGLVEADGVLAVFVAGLAFNLASTGTERASSVAIDEAVNRFAVLPLFLLLGVMAPWDEWASLGWAGVGLAVGVVALRRLPLLLALGRPLGFRLPDAAYLGWFGPVGVSALFYLTLEAERLGADPTVLAAGSLVVVASTVAHGVTGAPGRALYRRLSRAPDREPPSGGARSTRDTGSASRTLG